MKVDYSIDDVKSFIPLIEPSLLLDGITELETGKSARGYKDFKGEEWFFKSHFPSDPNVPSAIMIDAMSQILLMTFLTIPGNEGKVTACLKIDKVEFRRKVVPFERLDLLADLKSFRNGIAIGHSEGYVGKDFVCKADFMIGIPTDIQMLIPR